MLATRWQSPDVFFRNPRSAALSKFVCTGVEDAKAEACTLSRRRVLNAKLREVVSCWRHKFENTTAPDAWRALIMEQEAAPSASATVTAARKSRGGAGKKSAEKSTASSARQRAFERVYQTKEWAAGGRGPLSGAGSLIVSSSRMHRSGDDRVHHSRTRRDEARAAILKVIASHRVKTILDAPCGDVNYISDLFPTLEALNVSYIGVDVVRSQIESHTRRFGKIGVRRFAVVDLVTASPPSADLILCRQALQHLNAYDALQVLHRFSSLSGARLLLTTSYTLAGIGRYWQRDENFTPQLPGATAVLMDLQQPPFDLLGTLSSWLEKQSGESVHGAPGQMLAPGYGQPSRMAAGAAGARRGGKGHTELLGLWRLPLLVKASQSACSGEGVPLHALDRAWGRGMVGGLQMQSGSPAARPPREVPGGVESRAPAIANATKSVAVRYEHGHEHAGHVRRTTRIRVG